MLMLMPMLMLMLMPALVLMLLLMLMLTLARLGRHLPFGQEDGIAFPPIDARHLVAENPQGNTHAKGRGPRRPSATAAKWPTEAERAQLQARPATRA